MATQKGYTVRKRNNTSYEIRICVNGEKFYTTYHIPDDKKLSPSKLEQEITKCALTFKEELKQGFRPIKYKFSAYADYVLETMQTNGVKRSTISGYRNLLKRINPLIGNMELNEITPQILNRTYQKLEKSVKHQGTATCKPILPQILKEQGITRVAIHEKADIATNTVSNACLGRPIALESAEKIASALGRKTEELFEINKSTDTLSRKTVSSHAKLIGVIFAQAEKEMIVKYNAYTKSKVPSCGTHEADYFNHLYPEMP